MQCMKPIYLAEHGIKVPCRRCRMCKIAKSREWATRVMHQLQVQPDSSFVTLTYEDKYLPKNMSLDKRELQTFLKRLRDALDYRSIKYLAAGEYGDEFGRPHYHLIIFNVGLEEHELSPVRVGDVSKGFKCLGGPIKEAWLKGYSVLGSVTSESALYVMSYVYKAFNGPMEKKVYAGRQKPFQLQSRGIGLEYALQESDRFRENLGFTVKGHPVGLPTYYQSKLFSPEDKLRYQKKAALAYDEAVQRKLSIKEDQSIASAKNAISDSLWQNGLNVLARVDLRKKHDIHVVLPAAQQPNGADESSPER